MSYIRQLLIRQALRHKSNRPSGLKGYKVNYNGNLYKVIQTVNPVLEHQTPDLVPANYNVINEVNAGTEDDPIPYVKPMVVYEGKYYTYNDIKYKCTRDSGNALQYTPDQLVGHYFEIV